jgi:hypothetical protein
MKPTLARISAASSEKPAPSATRLRHEYTETKTSTTQLMRTRKFSTLEYRNIHGIKVSAKYITTAELRRHMGGQQRTNLFLLVESFLVGHAPSPFVGYAPLVRNHARHDGGQGRPVGGEIVLDWLLSPEHAINWAPLSVTPPPGCAAIMTEITWDSKPIAVILYYLSPDDPSKYQFFERLTLFVLELREKFWVITTGDANAHIEAHAEDPHALNEAGGLFWKFTESTGQMRMEPQADSPFTFYRMTVKELESPGPFPEHYRASIIDHFTADPAIHHAILGLHLEKDHILRSDHVGIRWTLDVHAHRGRKVRRSTASTTRSRVSAGSVIAVTYKAALVVQLARWSSWATECKEHWSSPSFCSAAAKSLEDCILEAADTIPSKSFRQDEFSSSFKETAKREIVKNLERILDIETPGSEPPAMDGVINDLAEEKKEEDNRSAEHSDLHGRGQMGAIWKQRKRTLHAWKKALPVTMVQDGKVVWTIQGYGAILRSAVDAMINAGTDGLLSSPCRLEEARVLKRRSVLTKLAKASEPFTPTSADLACFMKYITKAWRKNTSPGPSHSEAQLYALGGREMADACMILMKIIGRSRRIPKHWKEVLLVLIPKPDRENEVFRKQCRPIAMCEILFKAFDSVMKRRRDIIMAEPEYRLDPTMSAYRKGMSREMALFTLVEGTLSKTWQSISRNLPLPQILLFFGDLQDAFNGINRPQMEVALWDDHGVTGAIWELMKTMNEGISFTVNVHNVSERGIKQEGGAAQGFVSSSDLFNIVAQAIPKAVRDAGGGIEITEQQMSAIEQDLATSLRQIIPRTIIGSAYSDDVGLFVYAKDLPSILRALVAVSGKRWLRIHTGGSLQDPKTKILKLYGERKEDIGPQVLGGKPLPIVTSARFLGRWFCRNIHRSPQQMVDAVSKAKTATRMLGWLNLYSTSSSSGLLKTMFDSLVMSVIVASTTHTQLIDSDWARVGAIQAKVGRHWLRTSALASQWCVLLELGWPSTEAWIWYAKLCLLENIQALSDEEDAKAVLRCRISDVQSGEDRGLVAELKRFYEKSPLPSKWSDIRTTSKDRRKAEAKKLAFRSALDSAETWIHANPLNTGDYCHFVAERRASGGPAWHLKIGTRKQQGLMFAARCGAWCVLGGKESSAPSCTTDRTCRLCLRQDESVQHILLECMWHGYTPQRNSMMTNIRSRMSNEARRLWDLSPMESRRTFLLGKRICGQDDIETRSDRDLEVKRFMSHCDTVRQTVGYGSLCNSFAAPAPFSLAEAATWMETTAEDIEGSIWDDLFHNDHPAA